ncbi:hypothetical protein QFZ42_002394 [Variovorax paradoxus]|uniref:hypothetical protein n=1 Tax=Variovorax paradoxus TaxID=34073 RepID=UPI00278CBE2A|nr:hypothetical protein [Variovorax paradoxus]
MIRLTTAVEIAQFALREILPVFLNRYPKVRFVLDFDRGKLPEVARLLKKNYPNEVADLGNNAGAKLDVLLESFW